MHEASAEPGGAVRVNSTAGQDPSSGDRPDPASVRGLVARLLTIGGNRSLRVMWAKRLLPLGALALLGTVALWPELNHNVDQERVTMRHLTTPPSAGGAQLTDPRYRSVDNQGRPFTVTAKSGVQINMDRINLVDPKGDLTLENGAWIMVQAHQGVFTQQAGQLDLSSDAQIYRSDGTTLTSDSATIDTKAGVAVSSDQTHAEGPFGTLDAQGFSLLDKGMLIQFTGPARAHLNASQGGNSAQAGTPQAKPASPTPISPAAAPPAAPFLDGHP